MRPFYEAEEGDEGGSDIRGGEVDEHLDAMMSGLDNNTINLDVWGEISPITFLG